MPLTKVTIVGGAPSSAHLVPEGEPVWALPFHYSSQKHLNITRLFEIHRDFSKKPGYCERIAKLGIPLVVAPEFPIKADHISVFPFEEVRKFTNGEDYLTSSPAYMMAMALLEGAKQIDLYGIDMAVDDFEWFYQRPGMEAWVGLARGMGVEVNIPKNSPLGRSHFLYGRDDHEAVSNGVFSESSFKEMGGRHRKIAEFCESKIQELSQIANQHRSAFELYEKLSRISRSERLGDKAEKLSDVLQIPAINIQDKL